MAIFCVVFHTMERGFELSVEVASRVLQMAGGEGFTFNFMFGKTLRSSSQAVYLDCRKSCGVAAVVEYQQAAESMQWSLAEGSRFPFPSVLEGGKKGELALTPAQMTPISRPICGRRVWRISGTRYTPFEWEEKLVITWMVRPWVF